MPKSLCQVGDNRQMTKHERKSEYIDDDEIADDDAIDRDALDEADARFQRGEIEDALIWLERALPRGFGFGKILERTRAYFERRAAA